MDLASQQLDLFTFAILRGDPMTDDEFLRFCGEHDDLRIESNEAGEVEIMPGTGPETGMRNAELTRQVGNWTKADGRGRCFDSSTMFGLPSGARRSPDAAWIAKSRIATIPSDQMGGLWHICPEFVIELGSSTDRPTALKAKMAEWSANGAQLGWLIDPEARMVAIYRAGQASPELLQAPATLTGDGPVAGFTLDLVEIWDPTA